MVAYNGTFFLKGVVLIKVAIGVFVVAFSFLLLLLNKKRLKSVFEFLSIYWFRLAFSFLALFIANVAAGFVGVYVPVNVVSGLIITVLGIPGFMSICALALIL